MLPRIRPGDVARELPERPPEEAEPMARILDDCRELIEPNVTHWAHPGFFAYFASSGSGPGIVGELLAAGLGGNAMLWRTSPAATELEERVCDWLRQMIGLPQELRGHINDTASISSLLALAAARDADPALSIRRQGLAGRADLPALTLYASDQAHSSIDKAAITLGLGLDQVRRVASDEAFRMRPELLVQAIAEDRRAGRRPLAVVATAGTTSTTSVDPLAEVAEIARRERLWLHVDAAWAGSAAICPEHRPLFAGMEAADSVVVNPHKWLFTPIDCSVLFVREPERLKRAFSVVPEYLRCEEAGVTNLMDLGIQLGRRFRALKLWLVIRAFGVEGLRRRIREHCRLGQELAGWIAAETGFELAAPVPFSTVCFRAVLQQGAAAEDRLNRALLDAVNRSGDVFLSHTELHGRYVLRLSIGHLRTEARHVRRAWELLRRERDRLLAGDPSEAR